MNGDAGSAARSENLSPMIWRTYLSTIFAMKAISVLQSCLGSGSLFHMSSTYEYCASGSVMMPTIGSTLSASFTTGFSTGAAGTGMSLKSVLIFASTASTSMSPTTITAWLSGLYHFWWKS